MSKEKLEEFLREQSQVFSYENTALSEHRFSIFIDDFRALLEEL